MPYTEFDDPSPIAGSEQFKEALRAVRDKVPDMIPFAKMLRAHCQAPRHTITASKLAEEVGYPNYSSANMQYGILAHHVADVLHYAPKPVKSGERHWWRTLAYGNEEMLHNENGHYEWIMRPELVQALQELNWA
ncbi:MAG TPA: hypothetical protein VH413_14335 [Verrucomicrobiae bacterium]|nr:hypothetical protein [Verrucomicrobiae bacterium]